MLRPRPCCLCWLCFGVALCFRQPAESVLHRAVPQKAPPLLTPWAGPWLEVTNTRTAMLAETAKTVTSSAFVIRGISGKPWTEAELTLPQPGVWVPQGKELNATNVPSNGRIALLLRGQSFHGPQSSHGCMKRTAGCQIKATRSLVRQVIQPLADRGNTVDLFVTDGPCELAGQLWDTLKPKANTFTKQEFVSKSQRDAVERTFSLFEQTTRNDSSMYDLLIMARHDMRWKKPLLSTPLLNCSNLNFASPIQRGEFWGPKGVNDVLHIMPGSFFPAFRRAHCFNQYGGHECWHSASGVAKSMHASLGFIFWNVPRDIKTGRGTNEWYELCR